MLLLSVSALVPIISAALTDLQKQAHLIFGKIADLQNKYCHQFYELHDLILVQ